MAKTADPIEYARRGDVEYFKQLDIHILEKSRNDSGSSVLHEAAMEDHLECCKEIYRRSPSLVYHQNSIGSNVLHCAAWRGKTRIAAFLVYADYYLNDQEDTESGRVKEKIPNKKLLLTVNSFGYAPLHVAVVNRYTETARVLVQTDPSPEHLSIVDNMKKTALHYAVELQILEMVKLLVDHEPDFVYHVDVTGSTPLLTAARLAEQLGTSESVNIRKLLIEKQASQLNVRVGTGGQTLLHLAAGNRNLETIEEILQFGPDCLEVVDDYGNNFVHYAATFSQVKALEQILKIQDIRIQNVLNAQNSVKNTPLHIAAMSTNPSTTLCLLYDHRVSKTVKNLAGLTPVDLIHFDFDKERAGVFGVRDLVNEKELKDQSDFDLVVCALIATVSFTAGITVPGGYFSDGPNQGMAVLSKKIAFRAFIITNTWALLLSLSAVFCHFCTRVLHKRKEIDCLVTFATYCTLGAIFTMVVTFITGSYAVLAISQELAIAVCISSGSFFILAFYAIRKIVTQYRKRRGPSTNNHVALRFPSAGRYRLGRLFLGSLVRVPPS